MNIKMNMNISQMKRSLDEIVPEGNENESKKSKNIKDVDTNNTDDSDDSDDFENLDNLENMLLSIVNNKNILNKIDNHYDPNVLYKINLNLLRLNGSIIKRLNELKQKKECELNSKINLLKQELTRLNKFKFY